MEGGRGGEDEREGMEGGGENEKATLLTVSY